VLHVDCLLFFDIAAADSAFEDGDDAEYFHVSVSSMLFLLKNVLFESLLFGDTFILMKYCLVQSVMSSWPCML
jgi:hypothetical protein